MSVEQQLSDVKVAVVSGDVQRSQPVLAFSVGVGATVQQQACHPQFAELGGHVKRREPTLHAESTRLNNDQPTHQTRALVDVVQQREQGNRRKQTLSPVSGVARHFL